MNTESYELPILYTGEEREAYAKWGLKKQKTLMPVAAIVIVIDVFVTILFLARLFGFYNEDYWLFQLIRWNFSMFWGLRYIIVLAVSGFVIIITDLIFDIIWRRPMEPKCVKITLYEDAVQLQILQNKKILIERQENWEEIQSLFDYKRNAIFVDNNIYYIGENTIQTIYPPEKQKPYLDRPKQNVWGITSLVNMEKIMDGYQAAKEEIKKEETWKSINL